MPDPVEMPAPVKTTVLAEAASRTESREIADTAALFGVPRTRGKHIVTIISLCTHSRPRFWAELSESKVADPPTVERGRPIRARVPVALNGTVSKKSR
jgi:hypothetical protein